MLSARTSQASRSMSKRSSTRSKDKAMTTMALMKQFSDPPSSDYDVSDMDAPSEGAGRTQEINNHDTDYDDHDNHDLNSIHSSFSRRSARSGGNLSVKSTRSWLFRLGSNSNRDGQDEKDANNSKNRLGPFFKRESLRSKKSTRVAENDNESVRSRRSVFSTAENNRMVQDFFAVEAFGSTTSKKYEKKKHSFRTEKMASASDRDDGNVDAESVGSNRSMGSFLVYLRKREEAEEQGNSLGHAHLDFEFDDLSHLDDSKSAGEYSFNDDDITLGSGFASIDDGDDSNINHGDKVHGKSLLKRILGRMKNKSKKGKQKRVAPAALTATSDAASRCDGKADEHPGALDMSDVPPTMNGAFYPPVDGGATQTAQETAEVVFASSVVDEGSRVEENHQENGPAPAGESSEEALVKDEERNHDKETASAKKVPSHSKKTNSKIGNQQNINQLEMFRTLLKAKKKQWKNKEGSEGKDGFSKAELLEETKKMLISMTDSEDEEGILGTLSDLLATLAAERLAKQGNGAPEQQGVPSNLKGCLKKKKHGDSFSTASASGKDSAARFSPAIRRRSGTNQVGFDLVQIREYERVVGDNPACTAGPPISIGWGYCFHSNMRIEQYEYERPLRRSKRELHLKASVRTHMLKNEWNCTDEELRKARREAAYVQYCREKTAFSGTKRRREKDIVANLSNSRCCANGLDCAEKRSHWHVDLSAKSSIAPVAAKKQHRPTQPLEI